MSDTNVTALRPAVKDRTAAERSRRYRRKRSDGAGRDVLRWFILVVALLLDPAAVLLLLAASSGRR